MIFLFARWEMLIPWWVIKFVEVLSFFLKEISLRNCSIYLSICFFSKHQTPEVSRRARARTEPTIREKNHPLSWETPTLPFHRHEGLVCRYPVLFAPWWCFTTNCANPSEDANHKFRWMKQHKDKRKDKWQKKTGVFYKSTKKTLEMCFVSCCCCSCCCITICLTVYEPPWVFRALLVSIKNTAPGPKTFPTLWGLCIPGRFKTKASFTSLSKPLKKHARSQ